MYIDLLTQEMGETFYVGKGRGDRVFAHIQAAQNLDGDEISNKLKRIREIQLAGFEVAHIIHRHGMDDQTAFDVEAALAEWQTAWRLLYLPPHNLVRQLSDRPVFTTAAPTSSPQTHTELFLTLRNPAVPTLRVFVGTTQPKSGTFNQRRGLYFLRLAASIYVGKTDEFDVRLSQHIRNRRPLWWVFVTPEESSQMFTQDALSAAEALLISFWNEVSVLGNGQRGTDQKPAFAYLQQAILLVEAASATLLWLMRDQQELGLPQWNIPFKAWRGKNWPQCYLAVPGI